MKELITKQLLFDFFGGKTTVIQGKLIEEWLADPKNEEKFYCSLDEWERVNPQFSPEHENAQEIYHQLLAGKITPIRNSEVVFSERSKGMNFKVLALAGAIAASVLVVTAFLFRTSLMYQCYKSGAGQTSTFFLSDSTQVTLNANSCLKVPRFGFGKNEREVDLEGEAEFKVTHKSNNLRFRVLLGSGYQIEVLGTEFTAFSRARGKRVFLSKGKVKLELPEGKQLYMKPGNYFSSDKKGVFKVTTPAEPLAVTAWKEYTFYFDNTQLSEVAEQIEERFGIKVNIVGNQLANRRIGGIYQAREADELLQILSELLEIEITKKTDYIELRTSKSTEL
jgi:ferric-dicitrate binding protein FerR (iron transport regulator)